MTQRAHPQETLVIHDLTLRVEEAENALCAIRGGEVDALVVSAGEAPQVFILKGADHAHRILFETLNEGAMTIAADTTILCANRRLADVLDLPLERIFGNRLTQFMPPDSVEVFAKLLHDAENRGAKAELTLRRAGGDRVPVMLSMSAIMEDGENKTYTVVVSDLTDLKEAQHALERANNALEARVEARTRELERANEALRAEIAERTRLEKELRDRAAELVEADRRKDEFLSMLAHELRNPLAPLLTTAEMLRRAAHNPQAVERCRVIIERQTRNLTRLVDDLLDVSRITRRVVTLQMRRVALADIVRSAVEACQPILESRGHDLCVSLPSEHVWIRVDATRFEQVLVNLLNNAAKYTEKNGKISLTAKAAGDRVAICIRDNGVGIPADLLPRVFDLFVQGERTLDRSQGGLGIGLTLVKNLVEMHGGHVHASSDGAGQGSEFIIDMPIAPAGEESPGPTIHSRERFEGILPEHLGDGTQAGSASPRRKVLLVEDNADALESLTELLEAWGYEVRGARSGSEALQLASAFHPEVVLIDIGLPGMDGYEVVSRLRTLGGFTGGAGDSTMQPFVIAISGYGQQSDRDQAAEAGFNHYLVKPPDPNVLQELLETRRISDRG